MDILNEISKDSVSFDHLMWSDLISFIPHAKDLFSEYIKFCFVRNPYMQIISLLLETHNATEQQLSQFNIESELLHLFTTTERERIDLWGENRWNQKLYTHYHEALILDFIGAFENYEEDLKTVLSLCHVPYTPIVMNKRGHSRYLQYHSYHSINLVNHYCKDIFETFGYSMLNPQDFPEKVDFENLQHWNYDDAPRKLKNGRLLSNPSI